MNKTVMLAKRHGVLVGAYPSLPHRRGFECREMAMESVRLIIRSAFSIPDVSGFPARAPLVLHVPNRRARGLPIAKAARAPA
jgi:lactam utilization protein B